MCRNEYAVFNSINTRTEEMENNSKKAKLLVTLKRHPNYFENYKRYEEIKKENDERNEKEQTAGK